MRSVLLIVWDGPQGARHGKALCMQRILTTLVPNVCRKGNNEEEGYRRPWTKEEDERLAMLVELQGVGSWAQIAYDMPDRNGKQCREHWHNQLSGEVTVRG
eukprot:scaffold27312_cov31-Tisochrysis_lutea.AAC.1